jgi:tetratricopeptide (TPR) repeat protein
LKKAESDRTQYERALTYFDAALRQAPEVCYALEAVVPQLTDQETVLSRWRKIVQRHKRLDAHLQFGSMLWALDKPELALEQLLAAACQLESSTQEPLEIWSFQLFLSLLKSDRKIVADTRSILTKAQRSLQKTRDPRAHALWAYGLSLVGLIHAAMNHWQSALEQAPADTHCHRLLRDVLDQMRPMRSDQFAELLTKIQAIVDDSSEPLAYLEWGRTQSFLGNHDDAGREFERSDLPDGYAEWGSLLMAEGNADLAKEKLLHAFDLAEKTGGIMRSFLIVRIFFRAFF